MSAIGDSSGGGDQADDGSAPGTDLPNEVNSSVDSSGTQDETDIELSRDLVFDVLKNRRRRYALHYLKYHDESVKLSDLAEQVAAWENDTTVDSISAAQRKRVYTALYQSHLPKLDDAGIVDYNQNRGVVELSDASDQLDVYLELVSKDDIPWSKYYLGLAIVGMAIVTAAWLRLAPFTMVSDIVWTVLIVVAFTASAAAHTYYTRHKRIGSTEAPPELER